MYGLECVGMLKIEKSVLELNAKLITYKIDPNVDGFVSINRVSDYNFQILTSG